MRFIDGFRLAELLHGPLRSSDADRDENRSRARGSARTAIAASLREAIEAVESDDRDTKTRWLKEVTTHLRRTPATSDPRVAAIIGAPSRFAPRRRYRPPAGLRQHLTRWLRCEPTSVRAAREIAELEGRWDE